MPNFSAHELVSSHRGLQFHTNKQESSVAAGED